MQYCPKCASERIVKNGRYLERQKFRCKDCGFQFTRDTPRGRPATEKAMAILLYTLGLSFRGCPAYILLYQFSPKDTGQSKVK